MNIIDILQLKFPDASLIKDIIVQDDGQGLYIAQWNLDSSAPTDEELSAWAIELEQDYIHAQNKITNQPIYDALELIDLKSIRAIRSNDVERLASLETEAIALRAQLLPVS